MMTKQKRNILATLFALLLAASEGNAAEITLRIGAGQPTPGMVYVYVADTYFVPEVVRRAKERGYNVRFVKAWAGTIAKPDSIVGAVQKGSLDIGLSVPSFEQAHTPLLNYSFYFPFTTTDYLLQQKIAARMLSEVPAVRESMYPYNIYVLAMSVSELYGVISKFEWEKLEDLKGRKMAVAGVNAPWLIAVGATPVQLPIGENYTGIQTGLIEGNIFFVSGLEAFKLHEVAKHYTKIEMGTLVSNAMFMNMDTRNKLPKDLVDIIDKVAAETSVKIAETNKIRDDDAEAKAKADGVKIVSINPTEKRRWAELMKDLPGKSAKELDAKGLAGTQTYKAYVKFLTEAGWKFPYEYPF